MENLAKSFCVLLDGIYQRDKEIASLQERLEAWRATKPFFLMTPDILWEYGGEPEEIYQRLKDLNEL